MVHFPRQQHNTMKQIIYFVLICIILLHGCIQTDTPSTQVQTTTPPRAQAPAINSITNFEELDLSKHVGETITIKGRAIYYPLLTTSQENNFYGLRDANGFDIKFIPRGDRHIDIEQDEIRLPRFRP